MNLLQIIDHAQRTRLIVSLVMVAAAIAATIQYHQHGWINNDTVLYLEAARLFAQGEWRAGYAVFNWPLYSLLIAAVHGATSLGLHGSAQLLNVVFYAGTTYFLLRLIVLLGGDNLAIVAGALILFSTDYITGDVMEMLMRDQGFWACFLAALVYLVRFLHSRRWIDAVGWQVAIMLATLFRIEGIVYLFLLPPMVLLALRPGWQAALAMLGQSYALMLAAAVLLFVIAQFIHPIGIQDLGRLREVFSLNLIDEFTHQFRTRSAIYGEWVLGRYLDGFATQTLALALIAITVIKLLVTPGLISSALAACALAGKRPNMQPVTRTVLLAAFAIAAMTALLIITKVFVLSGRYVVAAAFPILIFAAFGLAALLRQPAKSRLLHWIMIGLVIVYSLGLVRNVLPKAAGHDYQQEAVQWLAQRNPENLPVYYSDARLRHYAGAPFIGTWDDSWERIERELAQDGLKEYEYLIISAGRDDAGRVDTLQRALPGFSEVLRQYNGKRKKKYVLILQNMEN